MYAARTAVTTGVPMIIMTTLDVTEGCTDKDHAMITWDDVEAFRGSGTVATRVRHRCRRRF